MSTAALVLGIVGLVMSIIPWCNWIIAIPSNILAIIFGAVARAKARDGYYGGEQHAKAGLVCGVVGVALIIAWILFGLISRAMFPGPSMMGGYPSYY